jgi:hypothetical protein
MQQQGKTDSTGLSSEAWLWNIVSHDLAAK